MQLVGHLFYKFGRQNSQRIVEQRYQTYQVNLRTDLSEHLREFHAAWDGLAKRVPESLSADERRVYRHLTTDARREGFWLARAFAGVAKSKNEDDFAISRASLADRLSITPSGATAVIVKLCEAKALKPTAPPVKHKTSARFRWSL